MEQWEALIQSFSILADPNLRDYRKVAETAKVVLKEDLAYFEIEWILQTLFHAPVNLLSAVSSNCSDDRWSGVSVHCFELVSCAVSEYTSYVEPYLQEIVQTCASPYVWHVRRRALAALAAAAEHAPHVAHALHACLRSFSTDRSALVGVICEHCPELLAEGMEIEIWRNLLRIFEGTKNTDVVTHGALHGVKGLLKHFGMNLPTAELNVFYDNLSSNYIHIKSCQDVCLQILTLYPHLFPERLRVDVRLRAHLWNMLQEGAKAGDTLSAVYNTAVTVGNVETIITTEVYPRIVSKSPQERSASCRIMAAILSKHRRHLGEVGRAFDKHASSVCTRLELGLDMKMQTIDDSNTDYDHDLKLLMDEASWCIECNIAGCEQLLRAMIILHTHIPSNRRKKLLIHNVLKAEPNLRTAAIAFLISESCSEDVTTKSVNISKYYTIWHSLFNSRKGTDKIVLDHCKNIFEDFIEYLLSLLEIFLDDTGDIQNKHDKLSTLLLFASQIIKLENAKDLVGDYLSTILDLSMTCLDQYGLSEGLVYFVTNLVDISDENCLFEDGSFSEELICRLQDFYKCLVIDRCADESLLCASCLALMQVPSSLYKDTGSVIQALQIIFTRNDVEPATLTKAIRKYEDMLQNGADQWKEVNDDIIWRIDQLRARADLIGKDARILQRHVVLFLGRYGNVSVRSGNYASDCNMLIVKLKDIFNITIPNLTDRTNVKVNLERVLDMALAQEEPKLLNCLLLILVSNLANKAEPLLQSALTAVIGKLSSCHGRGECDIDSLQAAVSYCDREACVKAFVDLITCERSPGTRQALSLVLQHVLTIDPLSETTERALTEFLLKIDVLLKHPSEISIRAGLDMIETAISGLKENDQLTIEYLPKLLINILKTDDSNNVKPYEIASNHFQEKILIFDKEYLKAYMAELCAVIVKIDCIKNRKLFKLSMTTLKKLFYFLLCETSVFIQYAKSVNGLEKEKLLIFLSTSRDIFEFDAAEYSLILNELGLFSFDALDAILEKYKTDTKRTYYAEVAFEFVEKYSDVLFEVQYQKTLKYVGELISSLKPTTIKSIHKTIEKCIKSYQKLSKNLQPITTHFEQWISKLPLENITSNIENKVFRTRDEIVMYSMKKMLKIMKIKTLTQHTETFKKLPKILLKMFATNYIDHVKNKMAYLTDVLAVTVFFLNSDDVKDLLLLRQGEERIGLKFVQTFIAAFAEYFLNNSLLAEIDVDISFSIFESVAGYFGRHKCGDDTKADIVMTLNKLWPKCTQTVSFTKLHSVLQHLCKIIDFHVPLSTPLGRWWVEAMCSSGDDDMVKLMQVAPLFLRNGDEHCDDGLERAINAYSTIIPTKWTPDDSLEALQAAMMCLSKTMNSQVMALAVAAVSARCVPAHVSQCVSLSITSVPASASSLLRTRALCDKHDMSTHLYRDVLLPGVRHSNQSACEEFYSSTMPDILDRLRKAPRTLGHSTAYKIYLAQCARAMELVQVAFEKLPLSTLESTSSSIYSRIELKIGKNLAQEMCKLCFALRKTHAAKLTDNADEEMKKCYRYFQTSNYNCLAAILIKTQPPLSVYACVCSEEALRLIADDGERWLVPIEGLGRKKLIRQYGGPTEDASFSHSLTCSATLLRGTLSDNPLLYTLPATDTTQAPPQTIILSATSLNEHPCSAIITQLFKQMLHREESAQTLLKTLNPGLRPLVAQIIMNCKEQFAKHASALHPTLLAFVATTPYEYNGMSLLNGLHVDILTTLKQWLHPLQEFNTLTAEDTQNVNKIATLLFNTCVHHKDSAAVLKAVLKCLDDHVVLYKEHIHVQLEVIEEFLKDPSNEAVCYEILLTLTKNGVCIQNLPTTLISKLTAKDIPANKLSNIAQLFGHALSSCHDSAVRMTHLSSFWKCLDKLRAVKCQDYVKVLFYCLSGYDGCCNEMNFRHITDLTPKMVQENKNKCLRIISAYISKITQTNEYVTSMFETIDICDLLASDHSWHAMDVIQNGCRFMGAALRKRAVYLVCSLCDNSVVKIRRKAFCVLVKVFEATFTNDSEPVIKKPKTEYPSPILQLLSHEDLYKNTLLGTLGQGLTDSDDEVRCSVLEGLVPFISNDADVRFAESLLISIYLPTLLQTSRSGIKPVPSRAIAAMLFLWCSGFTRQDGFPGLRLRDEPLPVTSSSSSTLLTTSRTFCGTFRTKFTGTASSKGRRVAKKGPNEGVLNVQVPLHDVLDTILKFAQKSPETSTSILISALAGLGQSPRSFPLRRCVSELLARVLREPAPSDVTPRLLEMCRACVAECCWVESFKPSLETLLDMTRGSEGDHVTRLLYEECLLRTADIELFVLGKPAAHFDEVMAEPTDEFSLNELTAAFGMLSNWDELTTQDKRVRLARLPALWAPDEEFRAAIDNYTDSNGWFQKMRCALVDREAARRQHYEWLRQMIKWPTRQFDVSAVTEAITWDSLVGSGEAQRLPIRIQPEECLAQWAARLMIRSCYLTQLARQSDSNSMELESRYSECVRAAQLVWCDVANRRKMADQALQCVRRNIDVGVTEGEALPWLLRQSRARRELSLRRADVGLLEKTLRKLDEHTSSFIEHSTTEVATAVYLLKLTLNSDLEILSKPKIEEIYHEMAKIRESSSDAALSSGSLKNFVSANELCLVYYDGVWTEHCEVQQQNAILSDLCECVARITALGHNGDPYIYVIVNRLLQYTGDQLPLALAGQLYSLLKPHTQSDEIIRDHIAKLRRIFPEQFRCNHTSDAVLEGVKLKLQLVCDPAHTLAQYCETMRAAVINKDTELWQSTYRNAMSLLTNPHIGTSYQLLSSHTDRLTHVYQHCGLDSPHESIQVLQEILSDLSRSLVRSTLNLTELCPALTRGFDGECEREGDSLARLLNLPPGERVVKIEKVVHVFTSSLRRPCVVRALLRCGHTVPLLVKRGEPLRVSAAACRLIHAVAPTATGYNVTPLGEDSGVIEYLEDHVTLRSLLTRKYDLDAISRSVRRARDPELILSVPSVARAELNELQSKVPSHALRSAIEEGSSCLQDFLMKKRNFQDSLATMAVYHCILGLGDRHLENYLYSARTGRVTCVDRAAILQYGGAAVPELQPARLTRLCLAVTDTTTLESAMQRQWAAARRRRGLLLPAVRVAALWMDHGRNQEEKLSYISSLLEGSRLPHHVTSLSLAAAEVKHKQNYLQLLELVFQEWETRASYPVHEQVSALMLQSTDPRILSVSRRGWEPWL